VLCDIYTSRHFSINFPASSVPPLHKSSPIITIFDFFNPTSSSYDLLFTERALSLFEEPRLDAVFMVHVLPVTRQHGRHFHVFTADGAVGVHLLLFWLISSVFARSSCSSCWQYSTCLKLFPQYSISILIYLSEPIILFCVPKDCSLLHSWVLAL